MSRLILGLCALSVLVSPEASALGVSPVQKVIQLLDNLRAKVEAEGKSEQEDFAEFAKYCDDEASEKDRAIQDAKAEQTELQATIDEASANLATLESKISELSTQISSVEAEIKSAAQNRAAGQASFEEAEHELVDTADSLAKGASMYKKSTSFLQASGRKMDAAQEADFQKELKGIKSIVDSGTVRTAGKKGLESFLEEREDERDSLEDGEEQPAYQQKGGGILQAIENMEEKAEDNLAEERKQEMKDQHAYQMLKAALENELRNLKDELVLATQKKQSNTEELAKAEKSLAASKKGLDEDTSYLGDLKHSCQEKAAEYEEEYRDRTNELAALAKAREILAGKFGGAGAAASFIQLKATTRSKAKARAFSALEQLSNAEEESKTAALRFIHHLGKELNSMVLVSLSLRASADPFAKVRGMIEDMISKLLQEEAEEGDRKAFCDKEISEAKASIKSKTEKLDTANARLAKAEARVQTLTGQIATLNAEVTEIDSATAKATEIRVQERAVYAKAVKDYTESQEACAAAIEVLRNYYEGASFLQTSMRTKAKVGSSVWDRMGDGAGVIGMLEVAESDFATLLAEARATEEATKEEFFKMQGDNKMLKATKLAEVKGKKSEIAGLKNDLMNFGDDRDGVSTELDAVLAYLDKLKPQCDNGPSYEEVKARREKEIGGLKDALEILDGTGVPVALL